MGRSIAAASLLALQEQDEEILIERVTELLNVAVTASGAGVQCTLCQELDDEHTSTCPVPVLEAWFQTR